MDSLSSRSRLARLGGRPGRPKTPNLRTLATAEQAALTSWGGKTNNQQPLVVPSFMIGAKPGQIRPTYT